MSRKGINDGLEVGLFIFVVHSIHGVFYLLSPLTRFVGESSNFLTPWGYTLKGRVTWKGEDESDVGFITVYNNQIFVNEDPLLDKLVAAL